MATIPTLVSFAAGEFPTATKLNADTVAALDFLLGVGSNVRPRFLGITPGSGQSVPTGNYTRLLLGAVEDTDSAWSGGSAYTVVTPGVYDIGAAIGFQTADVGGAYLGIYVNSQAIATTSSTSADGRTAIAVTGVRLNVGDTVWPEIFQSSGSTKALQSNPPTSANGVTPRFSMLWQQA